MDEIDLTRELDEASLRLDYTQPLQPGTELFDRAYVERPRVEISPRGIDEIPPLLHKKAVVFYPNGEGWYGVHPAVGRILAEAEQTNDGQD